MEGEISNKNVSQFNEAANQIQRANFHWINLNQMLERGELKDAHFKLDVLWLEFVADIGKTSNPTSWKRKNIFLIGCAVNAKNNHQLYWAIQKRIELIKELQEEVGKGGIWNNEDAELFE